MKTQNKKKIVVSALAIAMGAALAGSISGSVAWYQYSTKAAAQIAGTSAGTIGELEIQGRIGSTGSFTAGNASNFLSFAAQDFKPMSYVDNSVFFLGHIYYFTSFMNVSTLLKSTFSSTHSLLKLASLPIKTLTLFSTKNGSLIST